MNNKFENIMIVTDIDGTLLADDKTVPQRNIDAAKYFMENGGTFTLASGRNQSSIRPVLEQVSVNAPCLLVNGSIIYDAHSQEFLWQRKLNEKQARAVLLRIMEEFVDVGIEIFTSKGMCVVRRTEYTDYHMRRDNRFYFAQSIDDAELPWYKAIVCDRHDRLLEVSKFVIRSGLLKQYDACRFVFTEDIFFELIGRDTSKGDALGILKKLKNYSFDKIYGLGDNYNDIELLEQADVGVAPENAVDDILSIADVVVGDNNHGALADLVEYIERNLKDA